MDLLAEWVQGRKEEWGWHGADPQMSRGDGVKLLLLDRVLHPLLLLLAPLLLLLELLAAGHCRLRRLDGVQQR